MDKIKAICSEFLTERKGKGKRPEREAAEAIVHGVYRFLWAERAEGRLTPDPWSVLAQRVDDLLGGHFPRNEVLLPAQAARVDPVLREFGAWLCGRGLWTESQQEAYLAAIDRILPEFQQAYDAACLLSFWSLAGYELPSLLDLGILDTVLKKSFLEDRQRDLIRRAAEEELAAWDEAAELEPVEEDDQAMIDLRVHREDGTVIDAEDLLAEEFEEEEADDDLLYEDEEADEHEGDGDDFEEVVEESYFTVRKMDGPTVFLEGLSAEAGAVFPIWVPPTLAGLLKPGWFVVAELMRDVEDGAIRAAAVERVVPKFWPGLHELKEPVLDEDDDWLMEACESPEEEADADELDATLGEMAETLANMLEPEAPPLLSKRQARSRMNQVFVFKVWQGKRWCRIEVLGGNELAELDLAIRETMRLDTSDHLSEFYEGFTRKSRGYGHIDPLGGGPGANLKIAELAIEPADTIKYVYDFGDWLEFKVKFEKIVEPEAKAKYPRVTRKP